MCQPKCREKKEKRKCKSEKIDPLPENTYVYILCTGTLTDVTKCKSNSRNTSEGFRSSSLEHEVLRCRDLECWDQVDRPRIQK